MKRGSTAADDEAGATKRLQEVSGLPVSMIPERTSSKPSADIPPVPQTAPAAAAAAVTTPNVPMDYHHPGPWSYGAAPGMFPGIPPAHMGPGPSNPPTHPTAYPFNGLAAQYWGYGPPPASYSPHMYQSATQGGMPGAQAHAASRM